MPQPLTAPVRFLSGEREPCRVATMGNISLQGLQTIDDVALAVSDRVLVKDQTDQRENGIYLAFGGSGSSFGNATVDSTTQITVRTFNSSPPEPADADHRLVVTCP
ncbi:hypothetical protein REJC140_03859 [Pseudorhizobium endolithicum]|uniref:Lipoprotein n=1 Tax=Pseudorhizobium endolithicum TaxID=1191678 RepID=A0ABM8PRM1_9HYPH|nr:hypothetical protein [Pseudorhizobium endolithicum]CAD7044729.1 hypothetical protein REJC140_03859 [Pseudorhizobium endolithicum]